MTTAIIPAFIAMFIGDTFDLVKYQKGNVVVFDKDSVNSNLKTIDRSFTRSQYKLVETSTQAREFLDFDGALSLKIKKGEISAEGTGLYLKEVVNRQKLVELLIRVQHETITETVSSDLKPLTDWMSLTKKEIAATHYVRSITYGGELIASLKLKANNREEREMIKAAVSANLQLTGTFDLNANGSFDQLRKDLEGMYNLDIKVIATTSPSKPSQTVEDLMKVVENYPKDVNSQQGGKGKAIKAELYPLSSLKGDFENYLPNRAISSLLDDVETKFDDIRIVLHDFYKWNNVRGKSDKEQMVMEMFKALTKAKTVFHEAISKLDVSSNGKLDQFNEAFKAYGAGKENLPNRFQRWFWRLRHQVTNEPIVWEKPNGSGGVYINWGMSSCPSSSSEESTQLLYSGQAGGPLNKAWAGGRDYLCMKTKEPALSEPLTLQPKPALLESVEVRSFSEPEKSGPIPCAACLVPQTSNVKVFYAMTSCPKNFRKEYAGITLADSGSNVDGEFMCLNNAMLTEASFVSEGGNAVSKLNPVWMNCKDCKSEKIVPCVVCSSENKVEVF